MRIFQKGFNFSQDGPGNRLVYHLQGCNLRCIWCSNPEGMKTEGGIDVSVEEIVAECVSARPLFFSGGGVTFTGGEATLQHNELKEILAALKTNKIHTALETNGTSPKLYELLPFIDYLMMDFKHYDAMLHSRFTGADNQSVKENFALLCQSGRQLHVRIPLINNINTQNPQGFAEFFSKLNTKNTSFEFLAYHEYGKGKWTEQYMVSDGFVTQETVKAFKDVFEKAGLKVVET